MGNEHRDAAARRRRLVAAGGLVLTALCGVLVWWLVFAGEASRMHAANFAAIRPGMSRREVETLLGGPPGDYGYHADGLLETGDGSVRQVFAVPSTRPVKAESWVDDRNSFVVFFDDRGRVTAASRSTTFRRTSKSSIWNRLPGKSRTANPPPMRGPGSP